MCFFKSATLTRNLKKLHQDVQNIIKALGNKSLQIVTVTSTSTFQCYLFILANVNRKYVMDNAIFPSLSTFLFTKALFKNTIDF